MTASGPQFKSLEGSALNSVLNSAHGPSGGGGFPFGGVRVLLRLEGFAAFAVAVALYAYNGFSWPAFALLFLAPDLSMLAPFRRAAAGSCDLQSRPHVCAGAGTCARGIFSAPCPCSRVRV